MMKSTLAVSFGLGAAIALFGSPAQAQYESFRPPLGYYLNYECSSLQGREDVEVSLSVVQGGLALFAGSGLVPGQDSLGGVSRMLDIPAVQGDMGENSFAWQYEVNVNNVEDETQPTYRMVLLDQWASDNEESLTVFEYLPSPDGRPRTPGVYDYTCEVVTGGVNPFL